MKYQVTIKYADGTICKDHTYSYGRTEAQILVDMKAANPNAETVTIVRA